MTGVIDLCRGKHGKSMSGTGRRHRCVRKENDTHRSPVSQISSLEMRRSKYNGGTSKVNSFYAINWSSPIWRPHPGSTETSVVFFSAAALLLPAAYAIAIDVDCNSGFHSSPSAAISSRTCFSRESRNAGQAPASINACVQPEAIFAARPRVSLFPT